MDTDEWNRAKREPEDSNVALLNMPEAGRLAPPEPPGPPAYPLPNTGPMPPVVYPPPVGSALPPANGGYSIPGPPVYGPAPTIGSPPGLAPARRSTGLLVPVLIGLVLLLLVGVLAVLLIFAVLGNTFLRNTRAVSVGPITDWSTSVPLGTARSANVEITDGIGNLTLAGGATNLLDARFTYNIAEWKPEVNYAVSLPDNKGSLTVRQPSTNISSPGNTRYDWDLRLNNDVPINLNVDLGVGTGNLKLGGLDLTQVAVRTGVGSATVDLSGAWPHDVPIAIHGGVGQTTLILPRDTAVQVTVHGGLGKIRADGFRVSGDTYTNDRYTAGGPVLRITVDVGVGDITLEQK